MSYLRALLFMGLVLITPLAHAETKVYFSPNGGCQDAVIAAINKAKESIDVAMFSFTSRDIAHALLAAKDRNVKVRVVLDIFEIKDRFSKSRYLMHKGFDLRYRMGQGLMHNKFAVIDDDVVLTGSYNWTITADKKNAENLLVIKDHDLAHQYSKEFKKIWTQSGEGQLKELPVTEKTE